MIFNPTIHGAVTSDLMYIYVDHLPDKTSYYTGEDFDPTGMVVKGVTIDLVEVIIPNDQLSYIPPMPLRLGSELLRLIYIEPESQRPYGTTLSLDIKVGIWLTQEIPTILVEDGIELIPVTDTAIDELIDVININVSEAVSLMTVEDDLTMISITESLAPRTPFARAIFEFDIGGNNYVTQNTNNQLVLNNQYDYVSHSEVVDSGHLCALPIPTSDKSVIASMTITEEDDHAV
mgnify:CR=1 FL=1